MAQQPFLSHFLVRLLLPNSNETVPDDFFIPYQIPTPVLDAGAASNISNTTSSSFGNSNSLLFTLSLNSALAVLMVLIFFIFMRNFAVFNDKKKQRLIQQVKIEHEAKLQRIRRKKQDEEQEADNYSSPATSNAAASQPSQQDIFQAFQAGLENNSEPPKPISRIRPQRDRNLHIRARSEGGTPAHLAIAAEEELLHDEEEERQRIQAQIHTLGFDDHQLYFSNLLNLGEGLDEFMPKEGRSGGKKITQLRRKFTRLLSSQAAETLREALVDEEEKKQRSSMFSSASSARDDEEAAIGPVAAQGQSIDSTPQDDFSAVSAVSPMSPNDASSIELVDQGQDVTSPISHDGNKTAGVTFSADTLEEGLGAQPTPYQPKEQKKRSKPSLGKRIQARLWRLAFLTVELFKFVGMVILSFVHPYYHRKDTLYLYRKYGRDITVYITFQKNIIMALICCTFVGLSVLLPVHLTGTPPEVWIKTGPSSYVVAQEDTPLLRTTISMVESNADKLIAHVVLLFVFVAIFTFFLCRFMLTDVVRKPNFGQRSYLHLKGVDAQKQREIEALRNIQVAKYCVEIRGLPRDFVDAFSFDRFVRKEMDPEGDILKTVLLLDVHERIALHKQLVAISNKIEHYEYVAQQMSEKSNKPLSECRPKIFVFDPKSFKFPFISLKADAIDYYRKQRRNVVKQIGKFDHLLAKTLHSGKQVKLSLNDKKVINGSGRAFIVFNSKEDAQRFLRKHQAMKVMTRLKHVPVAEVLSMKEQLVTKQQEEPENRFDGMFSAAAAAPQEPKDENTLCELSPTRDLSPVSPKRGAWRSSFQSPSRSFRNISLSPTKESSQHKVEQTEEVRMAIYNAVRKAASREPSTITFTVKSPYEPVDIEYNNLFTYKRFFDPLRNILLEVVALLLLVFFSTPVAGVSSVERILEFLQLSDKLNQISQTTGQIGSLVSQYLPTLVLYTFSLLIPYTLWYMTLFAKYRSKSRYKRKIILRLYAYLVISTFVMPSLLITSVNGVLLIITSESDFFVLLKNIFLPGSGAFFCNYVLQMALLKNFSDLVRVGNLAYYLLVRYFTGVRTPREKLLAAELGDFYFEYEYAYMLNVVAIVLGYSMFTPVIMVIGLGYFLIKHVIDRYVIYFIYGHKELPRSILTTDVRSHNKLVRMVSRLLLINILLMVGMMLLFFLARAKDNPRMVPLTIVTGVLALMVLLYASISFFSKGDPITKHLVGFFIKVLKLIPGVRDKLSGLGLDENDEVLSAVSESFKVTKRMQAAQDKQLKQEILNKVLQTAYELPSYVMNIMGDPLKCAQQLDHFERRSHIGSEAMQSIHILAMLRWITLSSKLALVPDCHHSPHMGYFGTQQAEPKACN